MASMNPLTKTSWAKAAGGCCTAGGKIGRAAGRGRGGGGGLSGSPGSRGGRHFFLFSRGLGLTGGRPPASPDQQSGESGEAQERDRHEEGRLHGVDESADENIMGQSGELLLHCGWKS